MATPAPHSPGRDALEPLHDAPDRALPGRGAARARRQVRHRGRQAVPARGLLPRLHEVPADTETSVRVGRAGRLVKEKKNTERNYIRKKDT